MMKKRTMLGVAVLSTCMINCAEASIAFGPGPQNVSVPWNTDGDLNLGLTFTPNQDITVNKLGFFAGATTTGKEVAIFDSDNKVISSTIVDQAGLQNGYYWKNVAPVTLTAGKTYIVDEYVKNDNWSWSSTAPMGAVNPLITYGTTLYVYNAGGLTVPTLHYGGTYFGPNLDISAVPEPTTVIAGALLLLPFGASLVRSIRKNKIA